MDGLVDPEQAEAWLRQRRSPAAGAAPPLPAPAAVAAALASLVRRLPAAGMGDGALVAHVLGDVVPALTGQARSSRFLGFVTGAALPAAAWADALVARADQNVKVHQPAVSVATAVERAALGLLAGLLRLGPPARWPGRGLTTGATASNVLGLACGRDAVLAARRPAACAAAGVSALQVLTSAAHSSLAKAASIVGIGRACVRELPRSDDQPWRLDLDAVERELQRPGVASIVAVTAGDVNTGGYALDALDEWTRLRALADQYKAWIHVDGAFGIFARVLGSGEEYALLRRRTEGIELADSITVDGHKILNVPYDCGIFFTRSLTTLESVFTNPNAAYLASGSDESIPSPLNIGIENSRRFRALPVYAALLSEGSSGFERLVSNMVQLSRRIAAFLRDSPDYELLPDEKAHLDNVFIIVLFRAKAKALNDVLVDRINETGQLYVSGTAWRGEKAVRIAVSNWMVHVERDLDVVTAILRAVAAGDEFDIEALPR